MEDDIARSTGNSARPPTGTGFAALEALCNDLVGLKLFTCSRLDMVSQQAERIYSSDQDAYPVTGLKDIVPNRWTALVLDQGAPFVASSIEDLRDIFPDHTKIEALGLGAVINLPIHASGTLLGVVNILGAEGAYSAVSLERLRAVEAPARAAFNGYLSDG